MESFVVQLLLQVLYPHYLLGFTKERLLWRSAKCKCTTSVTKSLHCMNIPQTTKTRYRPVAPRTISVPLRGDRYFRGRSSAREPIVKFTHAFDKCQWSVKKFARAIKGFGYGENGGSEGALLPRNFTRPIFGSCFVRITVPRGGVASPVHVAPLSKCPRFPCDEVSAY